MCIQGEILSNDCCAIEHFKNKFLNLVENHGYSRDDVYSADETGINWKSLPQKSLPLKHETAAPGF